MKYLLVFILLSCSTSKHDPEISGILSKFMYHYQESLNIELGDEGNYYNRLEHKMYIKQKDWDYMSYDFKEMLIFHEAAHMLLFRSHLNDKFLLDGCPFSLLYWKIDEPCWKKHKKHYLKELFSRRNEF